MLLHFILVRKMIPFNQLMKNTPGKSPIAASPLAINTVPGWRWHDWCLSQQSSSHNLVIHFPDTAAIALVTGFTYPVPDTFLSSLIPLSNLPAVLETSLFAVQLPKKANKWSPLPKPPLAAQTRKGVISLLSPQNETSKDSGYGAATGLGCWGWGYEPGAAESWDATQWI